MSSFLASLSAPFFHLLGSLLTRLAAVLEPLAGASATAAAVVVFTALVRLAMHPLARSAVRGEQARVRLAPRLVELQRRYGGDPERLRREAGALYAREGASPLSGCLPTLVQLPVFFVMYRLFASGDGGAGLLDHTLLGAPLGERWSDALARGGPAGAQGLVYLGLFAAVAAVATWSYRRGRAAVAKAAAAQPVADGTPGAGAVTAMTKVAPLLAFGTLVTAAVVPLAAGLYLVTTTTWTAVERALLQRGVRAERTA
ncbi:membrane protein [Streptomyces mashuensis]|uniref:Membrane protein insertase YidC n=1 Tax=Streptomyces mashuensis TaxID=33904 RepID=A0A919EC89_9ACTN|nr:membrane protein insertase YidC [Streptomyces mashuensis]GHF36784.1 membrane protein [Streptomyces mashuensis]